MLSKHTLCRARRGGFSLVELAIVLSVVGVIIGMVAVYGGTLRQKSRIQAIQQAVGSLVEATRAAYGSQPAITGKINAVVPALVEAQAVPADLVRSATTTCSGTTANFLDSPWPGTRDACGNIRLCAWAYGTDTVCNAGAASPYFAIEFVNLDYEGCMAVFANIQPTLPQGLKDIFINGTASLNALSSTVATTCQKNLTNKIDFVYLLRVSGT